MKIIKKVNNHFLSENSGITLIALVITIIVLLILAGVTIQSLTSQDSAPEKAATAKEKTKEAEELEAIKLAVIDAKLEGMGSLNIDKLNESLKKQFNNTEEVTTNGDNYSYRGYVIYKNGNVEKTGDSTGTVVRILPEEYTQVEYLQSTGSQYINTGIYGITATDEFYLKASYDLDADNTASVFGWDDGEYYYDVNLHHFGKNKIVEVTWGNNNYTTSNEETSVGVAHEIGMRLRDNKLVATLDNVELGEINTDTSLQNQAHGLFARFRDNEPRLLAYSKVYQFKYWRNGQLYRNFIPCYANTTVTDSRENQCLSGTKGLYETVEGKFYTNQGTGEFLMGE